VAPQHFFEFLALIQILKELLVIRKGVKFLDKRSDLLLRSAFDAFQEGVVDVHHLRRVAGLVEGLVVQRLLSFYYARQVH
jgi:hypothetical protein